jgi:hypothetical protein
MYWVIYHPLSDTNAGGGGIVSESIREFTATALPPQTSYLFQLQVFKRYTAVYSSFTNLTVNTSEPLGKQLAAIIEYEVVFFCIPLI